MSAAWKPFAVSAGSSSGGILRYVYEKDTNISFVSRLAEIFNRNRVRRIKERKVLMRRPSSTGLNCYLCAFVGKPNVRVMEKKLVHVHVLVNAQ